ncbi:Asp23/Gls24 family envelope stress response protein [Streptomyces sp. ODS05-4]|uniref:Asp23/Gls24 family envelope stress response protein n=1 Tax=Streptomyces sp. ODS05-4 TaxID=2944939 RepID=UPI00272E57C9
MAGATAADAEHGRGGPDEAAETGPGGRPAARRVRAAERGATSVADRVVAKIAARAAREALGEAPPGPAPGALPAAAKPPRTTVVVHRDTARVHVSLELGYPADLAAQCGAVRRQVTRRVETLAGLAVREVAVHVEKLHSPYTSDEDRGRVR